MSIVHDMLAAVEKQDFVAEPPTASFDSNPFALDIPDEILNDFYDLKEHIRIAGRQKDMNVLAVADSSPHEGSATITTLLAFLLTRDIGIKFPGRENRGAQSSSRETISRSAPDSIISSGISYRRQTPRKNEVFVDWRQSADSDSETRDCILLVDANMRHPSLHRYFGLNQLNGLAEIIQHGVSLSEMIHAALDNHLHILTTGETTLNPAELLGSERFDALVCDWKKRYRYVIFHSPAVLNFVDAVSIASTVDGVVLVVKAGCTRWDDAQRAKQRLLSAGASLLGVTLNRRRLDIPDGLYKELVRVKSNQKKFQR